MIEYYRGKEYYTPMKMSSSYLNVNAFFFEKAFLERFDYLFLA